MDIFLKRITVTKVVTFALKYDYIIMVIIVSCIGLVLRYFILPAGSC